MIQNESEIHFEWWYFYISTNLFDLEVDKVFNIYRTVEKTILQGSNSVEREYEMKLWIAE